MLQEDQPKFNPLQLAVEEKAAPVEKE